MRILDDRLRGRDGDMMPHRVRVAGHFGEFLQGRIGADGPVVLVSLPCNALAVTGVVRPGSGLSIHGAGQRVLSPALGRALLGRLGLGLPGRVLLRATMPVGGGAGSSTAALVALAQLSGWNGAPDRLARACVAVEGASDPLMFPSPERMLWDSRGASCLQWLPPLPRLEVVGGFLGPGTRTNAMDRSFPDIADLVGPWCDAAERRDLSALGAIAATSAGRTLRHRGIGSDPTAGMARRTGALGWLVAHTGSARGLIFAPGNAPSDTSGILRAAGFHGVVRFFAGNVG